MLEETTKVNESCFMENDILLRNETESETMDSSISMVQHIAARIKSFLAEF